MIDEGGVDRVYAVAFDCLTRNMRDAVRLMDEFERADVEVRFVHQPELALGSEGRFLRNVLAAFAEFERDAIAARIADSRAYLKKHGRRIAGKVPYLMELDPWYCDVIVQHYEQFTGKKAERIEAAVDVPQQSDTASAVEGVEVEV